MNTVVLDSLKNRRSVRAFKKEQITDEELDAVLEAGTYAPTARGSQNPVIIAVQDSETVAILDRMNAEVIGDVTRHPYYGAPTILLVMATKDSNFAELDCSLVGGNLLNAAYAAGLGSCWIHRSETMFKSEKGKELLKKWGLPEDMHCICSIALGYADCPQPEAAPRKDGYIIKIK
ncbi:MAG: nitroreductase [Clostridia bacterium]|nr:nitroreductase [Clostridia bacterium]